MYIIINFIYFIINFCQRQGLHKRHKPAERASTQRLHTMYKLHIQVQGQTKTTKAKHAHT